MAKILVLCPTWREFQLLGPAAARVGCEIVFDPFDGDILDKFLAPGEPVEGNGENAAPFSALEWVDRICAWSRNHGIDGVTSGIAYPGMCLASAVAERLGMPGPSPRAVLRCDHKYYARRAQRRLVPEATPPFALVSPGDRELPDLPLPFFVKPCKASFSVGAGSVADRRQFHRRTAEAPMPEGYLRPFHELLRSLTDFEHDASHWLAEGLLQGTQVSLDGYVFDGAVRILGIVDAIMYPGTRCFERFQYPSSLPTDVRERMADIAVRFISGIGYDHALFNIEMIYNPDDDTVHIIEVNPKLAGQFVDLYEKVDGTNSFDVLLSLALGREPAFEPGKGPFALAASFAPRLFADHRVERVPGQEDLEALRKRYPDAWVGLDVAAGQRLSDVMQDGDSFRYAVINLGADSPAELEAKNQRTLRILDFRFEPV